MEAIGRRRWAIAEGYIPSESSFSDRALISHETACILNASEQDARVAITIFFANREPVGPYRVTVAARRTLHLRFNDLDDPQPIPRDTDYASVFESDVPIIVQHTRRSGAFVNRCLCGRLTGMIFRSNFRFLGKRRLRNFAHHHTLRSESVLVENRL
jgi:hypothetical protein